MRTLNHGDMTPSRRVLVHEHLFNRIRPNDTGTAIHFLRRQLLALQDLGVDAIVDVTPYVDPARFLPALEGLSIGVICAAGFYLEPRVQPADRRVSADVLTTRLLNRIRRGIGAARLTPGVLKVASRGEVLTQFEQRAMQAVGRAQVETGLPVVIHSVRGIPAQFAALTEAGAAADRLIFSHAQAGLKGRDGRDRSQMLSILQTVAEAGAFLCFDDFPSTPNPYFRETVKLIADLCERGHGRQIVLSNDCHWRCRRGEVVVRGRPADEGARTYDRLFSHTLPMLSHRGLSADLLDAFVTTNPRRALS